MNPNFEPLDLQLIKMEKKVKAGAEFFQTQAVYDPKIFEAFVNRARDFAVPLQYGIVIIKSPEMATYMNDHISGIRIPDSLIKEIGSVPIQARREKSIEIAVKLIKEIGPMVQGVHFMPIGWSDVVPEIISRINA
ncbi:MAG TPA: methylenetetrahydrofolate reductase [Syntrophorhabdaceae bacterium]|nr:methylenetetrahydrofolate reductase [Syntrophorhabdaceae bacterium]